MWLQVLMNIGLGAIWMFLNASFSASTFVVGYLLGALILAGLYSRKLGTFYLRRLVALLKLGWVFLRELVKANLDVLGKVIFPQRIHPGIIAMEVDFATDAELVTLANLITLTPGTMTIEISPDNKILYIHALDCSNPQAVIEGIRQTFERGIKEVAADGK